MIFIGIDPGVAGGIAWINEAGTHCKATPMPESRAELLRGLATITNNNTFPSFAMIEKVNAGVFGHAKQGQRMGVVSAFTFGRNVERCHMALTAVGIPYDEVLAVKWQSALGCRSRGDKKITKHRAEQLFPGIKVTHAIADALLIAEFCRRTHLMGGSAKAATPPAQREMFDGKDEESEEGSGEVVVVEVGADEIAKAFGEFIERGQRAARAAKATAKLAAGNGRSGHR